MRSMKNMALLAALTAHGWVGATEVIRDCTHCPALVIIPAGQYVMGAPEAQSRDRSFGWGGPELDVTIGAAFGMGVSAVTRREWAAFIEATGYEMKPCVSIWQHLVGADARPSWQNPLFPDGSVQTDDHPVVCVGWPDAKAYVDWLSMHNDGRREYFLPSEAQWEYAARAGSAGPRPWPIGEACTHANVGDRRYHEGTGRAEFIDCDDGHSFSSPVDAFAPNAFGLRDALGNVWEWTADCWHPDHTRNPADGAPVTAALGGDCARRSMRGAGFPSGEWYVRFTSRGGDPVETRYPVIGFRVAASLTEAERAGARRPR